MRNAVIGCLSVALVILVAAPARAQAPATVDFGREVLPIFKAQCYSCHGPTQQLNGFRLDRRGAALRGGTFPVIAPGSSAASRLYLRLLGGQIGQQMPPTGKLPDADIETIKNWLDQGASWPDAFAGESTPAPVVASAARIMEALRQGDDAGFRAALQAGGAEGARGVGARGGWTPLMYAALYGDADAVRRVLAAGADVNAANDNGTTALTLAVHDANKTRVLLQAGAKPNQAPDDGRTPLIIASGRVGGAPVVKLLIDAGADPKALSAARASALRSAAFVGEAESMRLLIAAGADLRADAAAALNGALLNQCRDCADLVVGALDARGISSVLPAAARRGDADAIRFLLARGADINVRDGAGRTPLMMAAHTDAYSPDVVRLLLEKGADATLRASGGETAASLAAIRGGLVADLIGRPDTPPSVLLPAPSAARSARHAVTRALPPLQKTDAVFLEKSGCVSCHHDSLTAHTVKQARAAGLPVDEAQAMAHAKRLPPFLDSWRDSTLHGFGIPGAQDTVGYVVWGAIGAGIQADAATDAMLYYLKGLQLADGGWRVQTMRPPIESSDIEVTALAMRSLQLLAPPAWRKQYDVAVRAAAKWLASAQPRTTEDRAFQLFGLAWTNADRALIRRQAQELLREQKPDGGWSPIAASGMRSDAYATGQALTALRESGAVSAGDDTYARGVRYLLSTQQADGSWFVGTRAVPVQAHFETGFPHGRDQFISAAATNWAVQALIPAVAHEPAPGK